MDYYRKRRSSCDEDLNEDKPNPYREIYKRRKLIDTSINHPLIYTVNNEVHFTAGVDKDTIEEVIKQIRENGSIPLKSRPTITFTVRNMNGFNVSDYKFTTVNVEVEVIFNEPDIVSPAFNT